MNKRSLLFIWIIAFGLTQSTAQNLADIFTNVDTIFMAGAAPGSFEFSNQNVTPIISNGPCNIPVRHYSVAREYQNGKVIAIGHEGLLANNSITQYDNLNFVINAIDWLNPGNQRVSLKEGWINNGNTSTLQSNLIANNYTFNTLSGTISNTSLANTDILILGNDWNGTQPYLNSELIALEAFVANGGSVFIAGLGWSWPQALSDYPMNAAANLFGFEYTTSIISDPSFSINGSPQFYNFYPENQSTMQSPYCPSPFVGKHIARGENLRVLRLAVSVTGEFTQQNGGANNVAMLLDNWLEEINDIYGREYAVRLEIIPNNDLLIFSDPATDPWATLPPGSGGCTNANLILSRQATVIDSVIGTANYDISHVIAGAPFGGGCAGSLKSGVSGGLNIPVTRHEIGHQFAQSHTINHSDKRNYEPENGGWTIQGGNGHGYAHGVSYHQTADFLREDIPSLGTKIPTNNTIPSVSVSQDEVFIPVSTPFTLTAIASDPDPNDSLTYVWDNMNLGTPQTIPLNDDSQGALFMRLLPTNSNSRTFPRMSDVIANNNSNGQEQLPTQPRILDIRLTVNDNHKMMYNGEIVNASGTHSDDIKVVVADAGPFVVTSQNTSGLIYQGGTTQTITWMVNGTDSPPINTTDVTIRLSTDGGMTYPTTLSNSTPNSGMATVTIPNISTTSARIRVEAIGSIYFDINTQDFEIQMTSTNYTQELDGVSVQIYPNPAKNFFELEIDGLRDYQLEMYNVKGQLINIKMINKSVVDVSHLAEGAYVLVVIDADTGYKVRKKISVVR